MKTILLLLTASGLAVGAGYRPELPGDLTRCRKAAFRRRVGKARRPEVQGVCSRLRTGATKWSYRDNMAGFAGYLAGFVNQWNGVTGPDVPCRVVDKTGLGGIYDIRIEYADVAFPLAPGDDGDDPAASEPVDAGRTFSMLFSSSLD